jgi:RimJ/RimL family protein N-acetyltransferase
LNDFPTLETDRLLLREVVMSDAPMLLDMHGDAEAMKWFGIDPITELSQQEGRLREAGYWLGEHCDLLQLSLLRAEFKMMPSPHAELLRLILNQEK